MAEAVGDPAVVIVTVNLAAVGVADEPPQRTRPPSHLAAFPRDPVALDLASQAPTGRGRPAEIVSHRHREVSVLAV